MNQNAKRLWNLFFAERRNHTMPRGRAEEKSFIRKKVFVVEKPSSELTSFWSSIFTSLRRHLGDGARKTSVTLRRPFVFLFCFRQLLVSQRVHRDFVISCFVRTLKAFPRQSQKILTFYGNNGDFSE